MSRVDEYKTNIYQQPLVRQRKSIGGRVDASCSVCFSLCKDVLFLREIVGNDIFQGIVSIGLLMVFKGSIIYP
jgi:hypothetical protein